MIVAKVLMGAIKILVVCIGILGFAYFVLAPAGLGIYLLGAALLLGLVIAAFESVPGATKHRTFRLTRSTRGADE